MKQGDAREDAMAGWDEWHEIQSQIKDLELLIAAGEEFQQEYSARLAELREAGEVARNRFESHLRRMGE
jgi:hypothetical protein